MLPHQLKASRIANTIPPPTASATTRHSTPPGHDHGLLFTDDVVARELTLPHYPTLTAAQVQEVAAAAAVTVRYWIADNHSPRNQQSTAGNGLVCAKNIPRE